MARHDDILKRRARFISAALVLSAGCSREQQATRVPPAESKPAPAPNAAEPAKTPRGPVPPPPDRPPLTAKVSKGAEKERDEMIAHLEKHHAEIEKLAAAVPDPCVLSIAECRARFKEFVSEIARIDRALSFLSPRCPAKTADDKAIEAMTTAHQGWLSRWLVAIEDAGRAATSSGTDAAGEFDELRSEAFAAHPQPCLKFYCP